MRKLAKATSPILAFCFAFSVFMGRSASAKPDVPAPPEVRTALQAPLIKPLAVFEHKLPNGLKVLLLERHEAPVITFQVWYRVGSRNENVGKSGLSHLTEHMMFQGSKNYPTGAYDRIIERQGGQNNAFTTEDFTAYYINFPREQLELAAKLEADRMENLRIPIAKFESELGVVKEERRWRVDNDPFGMMWEMLGSTAFVQHPYRWPVVGWMSDLDGLTHQDAWQYYRRHYTPNNAVVIVVGDFETPKAFDIIKKTFGKIPKREISLGPITQEAPQRGERRTEILREVETSAVMVAYHMPQKSDPGYYALSLASKILSAGRSSRLYHDLVYKRKMAQQVGTSVAENIDPGLFLAYAIPMPGLKAAALEVELLASLGRLKNEDVGDREIQKALNLSASSFIFGIEKNYAIAERLGANEMFGDWRLTNLDLEHLRAVTKADIRRAASATFTRKNRSVITLVPAREANE